MSLSRVSHFSFCHTASEPAARPALSQVLMVPSPLPGVLSQPSSLSAVFFGLHDAPFLLIPGILGFLWFLGGVTVSVALKQVSSVLSVAYAHFLSCAQRVPLEVVSGL